MEAKNPADLYLNSLARGSRPAMGHALNVMAAIASEGRADAQTFDWAVLTFADTARIRAELASQYAPATANKMLSALRGVLKNAWRLGLMEAEQYQRAIDLKPVTGQSLPAGRAIEFAEIEALVKACGQLRGARNAAIIGMMYSGLRRAEVVALNVSDLDLSENRVTVIGKRRKKRLVPLMPGVDAALKRWLALRGDWAGALFVRILRGERLQKQRLTTRAINYILDELVAEAGVQSTTPHDFRRTFISDLLDAGADIATVADLAGHSNIQTTRRYDRRGERARRRAMDLLHLPEDKG